MTRRCAAALAALALAAAAARADVVPAGDCAGAYWDLTASFDAGDRVYARVMLTRAGPGALNALAMGHWVDPRGVTTPFQNGRREGRFSVDAAAERIRIGSTELELAGDRHRLVVDNDKRGIRIRVEWTPAARAARPEVAAAGLSIAPVDVSSAASASVWRRGMDAPRAVRGFATLVRTRHSACEHEIATWRVDVHRLGPRGWLLVHQRLASGESVSFLDAPQDRTAPVALAFEGWRDAGDGVRLPRRMRANGPLFGAIEIGDAKLSIDPLEALPRLVRMLYWFGAQPRRVWSDASTDLARAAGLAALGDPPADPADGAAIASFTFLHPPEDPNRSPPDSGG